MSRIVNQFKAQCEANIAEAKSDAAKLSEQIDGIIAENESLKVENTRLRAERDAAVSCIDDLESYLAVMEGATEYVKPGTGIWHTIGISLDRIKEWRGTERGAGE